MSSVVKCNHKVYDMKTKIKYSLLALLMIVSTVISTISLSNLALAAPVDNVSIDDQANAFIYYRALAACAKTAPFRPVGNTYNISAGDVANGSWFSVDHYVSTGIIRNGDAGQHGGTSYCDQPGFISSALAAFGYSGKTEAFCDLFSNADVKRTNGSPCGDGGSGDFSVSSDTGKRLDSVKRAIEIKYYGGAGNPGPPGYLEYYIGKATFEMYCADKIKSVATATTDEKAGAIAVAIITDAGAREDWLYKPKADISFNTDKIYTYGLENGDGNNPTCAQIKVLMMDPNVDAYAAWYATHKPVTCKDQYPRDAIGLAACDAGFVHKSDPAYCDITYPVSSSSDPDIPGNTACKFGATKAAGGADGIITTNPTVDNTKDNPTTCAIDGIGWIVCPVLKFMAGIVDGAYGIVASLLTVQPVVTGSTGIYNAWSAMRNISNVVFVIVFLIIIFSQVTSVGITNYGIKKMLPRLVAAAILVNISFWICSIAVDASNIIGTSVNGVFKGLAGSLTVPDSATINGASTGGSGWLGLTTAAVIAGAAVLYITLSALLPALIVALLAIVTVFVVLTVRQALIVLLIVISPLAFVAFLLPNTESLFKKWRGLFQTMLLMFPIIGLMFGASALASQVIISTASSQASSPPYIVAIQIMGALVAIVPLALTPIIMKAAGGVLGKVGAFVNNPNKGPFDRMKKGARGFADDQKTRRGIRALDENKWSMPGRGAALKRRGRIDTQRSGRTDQLKDLQNEAILKKAVKDPEFAASVAGANAVGYQARAQGQLNKIDKEKVENEEFLLKAKFEPHQLVAGLQTELSNAIATANDTGQSEQVRSAAGNRARAAAGILTSQTGAKGVAALRETLSTSNPGTDTELGQSLRKDISSAGIKGKDAGLDAWSRTAPGTSLTDESSKASTWSGLSHEQIAGQTESAIQSAASSGGLTGETAAAVLGNEKISAGMGTKEKAALQSIADISARAKGEANYVSDVDSAQQTAIDHAGRLRETGRETNIEIAHEDASMQNALHDMENRNNNGS